MLFYWHFPDVFRTLVVTLHEHQEIVFQPSDYVVAVFRKESRKGFLLFRLILFLNGRTSILRTFLHSVRFLSNPLKLFLSPSFLTVLSLLAFLLFMAFRRVCHLDYLPPPKRRGLGRFSNLQNNVFFLHFFLFFLSCGLLRLLWGFVMLVNLLSSYNAVSLQKPAFPPVSDILVNAISQTFLPNSYLHVKKTDASFPASESPYLSLSLFLFPPNQSFSNLIVIIVIAHIPRTHARASITSSPRQA